MRVLKRYLIQERALSCSELYSYLIDQCAPFNVQCIVDFCTELNDIAFKNSLDLIQKQHPFFQVSFVQGRKPITFLATDEPIAYEKLPKLSAQKKKQLAQTELNSSTISVGKPLCRVKWLADDYRNKHSIIFTVHHAIADGVSLANLAQEFLKYCEIYMSGLKPQAKIYSVHSSLESLLPKIDHKKLLTTEDELKIPEEPHEQDIDIEKDISHTPKKETHTLYYSFSIEQTRQLAIRAKEYQTTVHGALSSAALLALQAHMKEERKMLLPRQYQYISPMNLRPIMLREVSNQELGHYVGCFFDYYFLNEATSFWPLAYEIKRKIRNSNPIEYIESQQELLKKYNHPEKLTHSIQWRRPVVGVTNIGIIDRPLDKKSCIEKLHIINSMPEIWNYPYAYFIGALTVNGRLCIDLMYSWPTISMQKAKRYLNYLVAQLKDCCDDAGSQKI